MKTEHKLILGDSKEVLKKIKSNSVHLVVTSPPYFNAREYAQWDNLQDYLNEMKEIFKECYRVLDNHRIFVLNVGDVNCLMGKQPWTKERVPLGSLFTVMLRDLGFQYVDNYIWDKGEPQSYRHQNGNNPFPHYIYPINCYEHILIFHKHIKDMNKVPCPVCGSLQVQNNSQSEIGVQSWECNNPNCLHKSPNGRGKRFSARSVMMSNGKKQENKIDKETITKWRRDIVKFSPVIKWLNGENKAGHTAPYPLDIPETAIKFYTYVGDVVLDPFAGSFTTNLGAMKLNRNSIGIDAKKEYIQLGKKRLFKENINKNIISIFKFDTKQKKLINLTS